MPLRMDAVDGSGGGSLKCAIVDGIPVIVGNANSHDQAQ